LFKVNTNIFESIVVLYFNVFRLGNYRMPFAWSARPLFRLYSSELDTSSDFLTLYRQDFSKLGEDDMVKILMEYRK